MRIQGAARHRNFRLLWGARTISTLGDQFWRLALPSTAILALGASAAQVGVLGALSFAAWPALALVAGVWVDRLRRRPVMVICDVGRALAVASVPAAFALGRLTLAHLFAVAAVVGVMDVFFDLAATAHTPELVPKEDWADANAKLEMGQQAIAAAGPSAAGVLISVASAPLALVVDAVSFVASAAALARTRSALARPVVQRRRLLREALDGWSFLRRQPALLRITFTAALSNLGIQMALTVQLLFLYRVVGMSPAVVGACLGAVSVGSVIGAALTRRAVELLGIRRALTVATGCEGLAWLLTPAGVLGAPVVLLVAGLTMSGFFNTVWNVGVTSFRQHRIPPGMMGRVTAAGRMIGYGSLPLGALLGGLVGQVLVGRLGLRFGLTLTMLCAALVAASSALIVGRARGIESESGMADRAEAVEVATA